MPLDQSGGLGDRLHRLNKIEVGFVDQAARDHVAPEPVKQTLPEIANQDDRPLGHESDLEELPDHEKLERGADPSRKDDEGLRHPHEVVEPREESPVRGDAVEIGVRLLVGDRDRQAEGARRGDRAPFLSLPMKNDKPEKKVRREPDVGKIIDRTIVRLWDTIEELEALTPAELRFYRVAVFGSARLKSGDQEYVDVRGLASRLTEMGCDIVTGGGPGLMEAANEGAAISRGTRKTRSFGLTIAIPYEKANPYLDSVTAHRTFFSRLHHFVRMSQAFVIFPGGIGTALELFMVWQLLQVGFMTERPVVLVGDLWKGLLDWLRRDVVPRRLINEPDLDLVQPVETISEAAALIERHKRTFDEARERFILERRRAERAEKEPPAVVVPVAGE